MEAEEVGARRGSFAAGALDLAAAVAFGAFVCSVAFDTQAQRDGEQFIYARGGYLLVCLGLITGVVAAVLAAAVVGALPRASAGFRRGVQVLVLSDAVLVWFAITYLVRHDEPAVPIPLWMLAGSLGAVVLGAVGRWQAGAGPSRWWPLGRT